MVISVEVVHCPRPGATDSVALSLNEGSTVGEALAASGLLAKYGIEAATASVGVWARKQTLDTLLRERDRVEIYRPLQCDPKEARRLRYKQRSERIKTEGGKAAAAVLSGNPKR
mgnify:CR=1 FL=1